MLFFFPLTEFCLITGRLLNYMLYEYVAFNIRKITNKVRNVRKNYRQFLSCLEILSFFRTWAYID
jgi:hypothetical protein